MISNKIRHLTAFEDLDHSPEAEIGMDVIGKDGHCISCYHHQVCGRQNTAFPNELNSNKELSKKPRPFRGITAFIPL